MGPSSKRAAFARPFWNAATCYGTAHATTTFHEQHNKRDYRYSHGRCGDFVSQSGQRGLALGYLTKVRFVRFLSTPMAATLTGVDLSRPGQGAERASRLIVVAEEFFSLLVRYSLSHPFRDGDYGNVERSRKLPHGSFCIFTGFQEALASVELEALRAEWRARYAAPVPDPEPLPPAPEAPSSPSAPPPPPPPPATAPPPSSSSAAPSRAPDATGTLRPDRIGPILVAEYEAASARGDPEAVHVGPSGCCVLKTTKLFTVQRTIARRGAQLGRPRVALIAKGALKRALRVAVMRSVPEVCSAVNGWAARSTRPNN
jgi:hypothetical protein